MKSSLNLHVNMSLFVNKVHKDSSGYFYIDNGQYVTGTSLYPVSVSNPKVDVDTGTTTQTIDFSSTFKTAMYKIDLGLQGAAKDLLKRFDIQSPIIQTNPPHLDYTDGTIYWSQGRTTTKDFLRALWLIGNNKKEDNKLVVPTDWCPKSITPKFENCPIVAPKSPAAEETKKETGFSNLMVMGGIFGVLCMFCICGITLFLMFKRNS